MTSNTENTYEKLSANDRIDVETDILKAILDDGQFNCYKQLAEANDKC